MDFTSSIEDIQNKLVYAIPKGRTALLDAIYWAWTACARRTTSARRC